MDLKHYKKKEFRPEAIAVLRRAHWRGNVRELRNAVERLLIMTPGDTIGAQDLPAELGMELGAQSVQTPRGSLVLQCEGMTLQNFKDTAERSFLVDKLREHEWNVAATAKAIETPRSNLYKKLDAYDINREGEA